MIIPRGTDNLQPSDLPSTLLVRERKALEKNRDRLLEQRQELLEEDGSSTQTLDNKLDEVEGLLQRLNEWNADSLLLDGEHGCVIAVDVFDDDLDELREE